MRRGAPLILALLGVFISSGCGAVDEFSFADFVTTPPGLVTAEVHELQDAEIGLLLSEVRLRYDSYIELRGQLPVGLLLDDVAFGLCESSSVQPTLEQFFVLDVPCHIQSQGLGVSAAGAVGVGQSVVEDAETFIVSLSLSYGGVQVAALSVDGEEKIDQVEDTGDGLGASLITLNLEQNGRLHDYEFRVSVLDDGRQVIDYQLNVGGDLVGVRLSDPATLGGYLSATVIGMDGSLACEIRNADWLPGEPVRGTCDNGAVFGL
ncbi:MAG: hypothetical protein VYE15_06030 [Myxococcota bacterium]|nr:hypothetical protein [Myxococcota bacterium]